MTFSNAVTSHLGLPSPAKVAPAPLDALLARSGKAFIGVFETSGGYPPPEDLRRAIDAADGFLQDCLAHQPALREAVEPLSTEEIREQLITLIGAWPNLRDVDLTAYGAQLLGDVRDRQPCRYALREGLRKVRQTLRFLPSIAEVLEAVDEAQTRVRNTAFHVNELPAALDKARVALARVEARQASIERHRSEQAALREKAEMQPGHLQ